MRGLVAMIHYPHLFLGLLAGHIRFHPPKNGEVTGPAFDDVGRQPFLLEDARSKNVGLDKRKLQAWRHDPHDGEGRAVQGDRLAENVLVAAKTFLPEGVGQHRDIRATRFVFFRREDAAKEWLHTQGAKEVFRYANAVEILRVAPAGEGEAGEGLRGKFRETRLLIAPGGKARPGNISAVEPAFRERTPDAHQLFRTGIGKRPEKERVD